MRLTFGSSQGFLFALQNSVILAFPVEPSCYVYDRWASAKDNERSSLLSPGPSCRSPGARAAMCSEIGLSTIDWSQKFRRWSWESYSQTGSLFGSSRDNFKASSSARIHSNLPIKSDWDVQSLASVNTFHDSALGSSRLFDWSDPRHKAKAQNMAAESTHGRTPNAWAISCFRTKSTTERETTCYSTKQWVANDDVTPQAKS